MIYTSATIQVKDSWVFFTFEFVLFYKSRSRLDYFNIRYFLPSAVSMKSNNED